MRSISISSRIEGGKFKRNSRLIKDAVSQFEGKEVEITIKRKYKQRSLPQNAFYWGVILPFFQQLLNEAWGEIHPIEDIHEMLKAKCNYREIVNPATGEIETFPMSTKELTTAGWLEYEGKMALFAKDYFNAVLPVPNEQMTIDL